MAEWLGIGLQNRAQQFDSAWYLFIIPSPLFPSRRVVEAGAFFHGLSKPSELSELSVHSAFSECSENSGKTLVHTADFL